MQINALAVRSLSLAACESVDSESLGAMSHTAFFHLPVSSLGRPDKSTGRLSQLATISLY